MATCPDCANSNSLEDLLRLVIVCDDSGNVSWRGTAVEGYTTDCLSCDNPMTVEDLIRKSIYCNNGVHSIRFSASEPS